MIEQHPDSQLPAPRILNKPAANLDGVVDPGAYADGFDRILETVSAITAHGDSVGQRWVKRAVEQDALRNPTQRPYMLKAGEEFVERQRAKGLVVPLKPTRGQVAYRETAEKNLPLRLRFKIQLGLAAPLTPQEQRLTVRVATARARAEKAGAIPPPNNKLRQSFGSMLLKLRGGGG